jgi:hypothetical protein
MGMGATPVAALGELRREAQELAQQEGPAVPAVTPPRSARRPGRTRLGGGTRLGGVSPAATRTNTAVAADQMDRAQGGGSRGRPATPEEARRARGEPEPASSGPQVLRFEVVDVRLTPGVMESGGSGWLASGTLVREGGS